MPETDYKKAYERQKLAREKAEALIEDRSRELFEANNSLRTAYEKLQSQQENLVQQEKLAALGMLAAGVAHEINNPIGYVNSNLQTLAGYYSDIIAVLQSYEKIKKQLEKIPTIDVELNKIIEKTEILTNKIDVSFISTDGSEVIQECLDGTKRVARIVSQLRNYARTDDDPMGFQDVNQIIDNILKLVWNDLKYKCKVIKHYGKLQPVYGSGTQLGQVFLNIIVNASQAIEDSGEISISTEQDNECALIAITDTGAGIDSDTLNKIFDPFFTTKEVGSGTGLGLSIVQGIIKKHRGTISVDSEPGKGTTFTISIPLYPQT